MRLKAELGKEGRGEVSAAAAAVLTGHTLIADQKTAKHDDILGLNSQVSKKILEMKLASDIRPLGCKVTALRKRFL